MISVELSLRQLINAVKQLSAAEKLELNEVIWAEDITIPIEHQNIVNERITAYKSDPEILLDWNSASKDLKL